MKKQIKLNEYIEKFSEIKPRLDEILESLHLEEIEIENDGCSNLVVNQCVKYIKDHDVKSSVVSQGASALKRLYGGF